MRSSIIFMKWARSPQNEKKVPFQEILPLRLRNHITGKSSKNTDQGCLHEITTVISCLEKHQFEDKMCTKEAENFQNCYRNYLNNRRLSRDQANKGVLKPGSKDLQYRQINQLLAKYPQK